MKYHASSCYRHFQLDLSKIASLAQSSVQLSESLQQAQEPTEQCEPSELPQHAHEPSVSCEQRSKRFRPSETKNVCIFCGADRKTVKQKIVHTLYRICEKPMAQKLLNAAMLFKDHVYTETAIMSGVDDVFAADILYHDYCCKAYFNKYQAKIAEIMKNLEMEDSVAVTDDSFKARFLALQLDFSTSAYSLSSIRDRLNEGSADVVSNKSVKQLIIELYGDTVCFTYPCNKRISQMVLRINSSPKPLVESLRISPWRDLGLQELWLVRNSGVRRSILPLHDICSALGNDLIKCLPAVHTLTGCDTTSKIATKYAALNTIRKLGNYSLLLDFNSPRLTEGIIQLAEVFLVKCLKPTTGVETFDDLRVTAFSSNALKMDFEKTPCTSTNARKHILRAYYQLQLWIQAPFRDATSLMNAEAYGFERRDNLLLPEIVISKSEGLPDPCRCGKCARKNSC